MGSILTEIDEYLRARKKSEVRFPSTGKNTWGSMGCIGCGLHVRARERSIPNGEVEPIEVILQWNIGPLPVNSKTPSNYTFG